MRNPSRVLLIGDLPPPTHGQSVSFQMLCERALSEAAAEIDYGRVEAELAAATAQQHTLEELRKLR